MFSDIREKIFLLAQKYPYPEGSNKELPFRESKGCFWLRFQSRKIFSRIPVIFNHKFNELKFENTQHHKSELSQSFVTGVHPYHSKRGFTL